MKILVYIRKVINSEKSVVINSQGEAFSNHDELEYEVNAYDLYAIEEALKIKQAKENVEVVGMIIGDDTCKKVIDYALAMGMDRMVQVTTNKSYVTIVEEVQCLKHYYFNETFDLILTGRQRIDDGEYGLVYYLGQVLELPCMNSVIKLDLEEEVFYAQLLLDSGKRLNTKENLPAVLGLTKGINEPRYPTLRGIMLAKKKQCDQISIDEIVEHLNDSMLEKHDLKAVVNHKECIFIEQDAKEELIQVFKSI
ncbi:electron transfer flavoprotein subunit beta/FixA family protein [Cellulosilyticum ruminicola]|uniref:electron transfer flavoprotein subunit beta/FixA family protein n=1 Tax=Cellulosilyticum ruminicola TaxID=425254 RepID=UPI0006D020F5|nr:hypothetical protein [Cellulosilyticum ruminicola]